MSLNETLSDSATPQLRAEARQTLNGMGDTLPDDRTSEQIIDDFFGIGIDAGDRLDRATESAAGSTSAKRGRGRTALSAVAPRSE